MENHQIDMNQQNKRPVFLTVLCILTFISTGISLLSGLIQLLTGKSSSEAMDNLLAQNTSSANQLRTINMNFMADQIDKIGYMAKMNNEYFYSSTLLTLLITLIGLFGAVFMMRGRKLGFHFYIIYTLAAVSTPFLFVGIENASSFLVILGLIFGGLFVLMYSRNLKWLK